MLEFNTKYQLDDNQGDGRIAEKLYVIAHDTGNPNNTGANSAENEAAYMKGHYQDAYTHFIVGDNGIFEVGTPGYVAWGALDANPYSPVQIELAHVDSTERFQKSYKNYIDLLRWACSQYGIPTTLDAGGAGTPGVKSHLWVTQNYGGDHTDPYGYLASWGISKEQFAHDIANGVDGNVVPDNKPQPKPTPQPTPAPSNDDGSKIHDENGTYSPYFTVNVRTAPSTSATVTGQLNKGDSITYYGYVLSGGYVWCVYTNYSGKTRYVACREIGGHAWGTLE